MKVEFQKIGKSTLNIFATTWIPNLTSLLLLFIIPRALGVLKYGQYILLITIPAVVSIFLNPGIEIAAIKFISNFSEQKEKLKAYWTLIFVLKLIFVVPTFFLILFMSNNISILLFGDESMTFYIQIISSLFLLNTISSVFSNSLIGMERTYFIRNISVLQSSLKMCVVAVLVFFSVLNIMNLLLMELFISSIILLIFLFDFRRFFVLKLEISHLGDILRYSGSLWANEFFVSLYSKIDKFVINAFVGPSSVAFYSLAQSLLNYVSSLINSLSTSTLQFFSKEFNKQYMEKVIKNYFLVISPVIVILTSLLFFSSGVIVQLLYGPQYSTTALLFSILIWVVLGRAFNPVFGALLMARGKISHLILSGVVTNIVYFSFLFTLAPRFGVLGATVSFLSPYVLLAFWMPKLFLKRSLHIEMDVSNYVKFVVLGLSFVFPIFWIGIIWPFNCILFLIPFLMAIKKLDSSWFVNMYAIFKDVLFAKTKNLEESKQNGHD